MKIAMLAPITWRTPPRNYGPWEQVTSVLTEALVKNGMEVSLFATGDSLTSGTLEHICEKPLGEYPGDAKVWECLHISNLMERSNEFDILHNHFDFLPLTYSKLIQTPMITTIHGFSSEDIVPVYKKYNRHSHYVSISNSDRHADLNYIDTVYNGLDESQFSFGEGKAGYLLYFGRIHPHKGTKEAIEIAIASQKKLIICGLIQDNDYYEKYILPHINGISVVYKGNVGPVERNELLGNAAALLHPISFEEPFGLSVAEAMLCGTPVIAFNRGAMKELIVEGKTGWIVPDTIGAIDAVKKISTLSRRNCRDHALSKFSGDTMARNYTRLYEQVISGTK